MPGYVSLQTQLDSGAQRVVGNLLCGDFFPRQLPCYPTLPPTPLPRSKLATIYSSGLEVPHQEEKTPPNVQLKSLGWCPLATPEPISLALEMECCNWPDWGHMLALNQSITVAVWMEHSDWPELGHMPALGTWSRQESAS